jgi:hypothetical protein
VGTRGSVSRRAGDVVENPFFLGSSGIRPTLLGQHKMLMCTACHERIRVMCIRFHLQDIHRFESS